MVVVVLWDYSYICMYVCTGDVEIVVVVVVVIVYAWSLASGVWRPGRVGAMRPGNDAITSDRRDGDGDGDAGFRFDELELSE